MYSAVYYLAHPTKARHRIREWELDIEARTGLVLVNPFYDPEPRQDILDLDAGRTMPFDLGLDAKALMQRDLRAIDRCKAVLAIVTPEAAVGLFMEVFYAWEHGYPVLLVCEIDTLRTHPWLRGCATKMYSSLAELEQAVDGCGIVQLERGDS